MEGDISTRGWSNIKNGNIVYGGESDIKNTHFSPGFGAYNVSASHSSPFSTNTVKKHFEGLSQSLAGLQSNGKAYVQSGTLILNGTNSFNVFNINSTDYQNWNQIGILAPAGSTVIVNYFGTDIDAFGGYLNGVQASNVLFNFSEAESLGFQYNPVPGSYLAPYASISGSGYFDGQIIGNDIDFKGMSMSGKSFTGNIPASAIPRTFVLYRIDGYRNSGFLRL